MRTMSRIAVLLLIALAATGGRAEEETERQTWLRANYTKFEYRVPMRDGVKLFTSVYVPNNHSPNNHSQGYPFLLFRTPYAVGPYGVDRYPARLGPTEQFEKERFIFAFQDVRGRFLSEGQYVNMRPHIANKSGKQFDESSDTYDTIEWLLKNVHPNNGRAGQWGISYPGFYTAAGAIDSHPALKAVSPQAPIADWFWDDMHRNGAFVLPLAFNFFSSFGVSREGPTTVWPERFDHQTPDGYQFFLRLGPLKNANLNHFKERIAFWNEMTRHPNYDDFWQSRNILPHLKDVNAAVLVVGGWFDTEDLYGPLQTYASIERNNPDTFNALVMGPWSHGQWRSEEGRTLGSANWGFATADHFREQLQFPFFMHYLKDGPKPQIPEATVFETGANRWRQFEKWPPSSVRQRSFYFRDRGRLTVDPSDATEPTFDEFVSDPAKPVPYTMEITANWAKQYMTEDQRFAAWRPDVLVYQTEPLEADLTVAGPLEADLYVSTSRSAADWIVKLIDVYPGRLPGVSSARREQEAIDAYPGGRQMLVRATPIRGRFRNSFSQPEPFVPGEVTRVRFRMNDCLHTFKRGHRLMVQVQSSWFPFIDRNPQTYVPNIFEAHEKDFVKATHRVYRNQRHPSRIRVGLLSP